MKTCDGCNKPVQIIVRRHKELLYCRSCYTLYFRSTRCFKCGKIARLPTFEKKPICRACEKMKPCVRCGVEGKKLGKLTKYGVVCKSCYKYFVKPKKGILSSNNDNFGTCSRCHRHRKLTNKVCKKCLFNEDVLCIECGKKIPAGRGKACEECYWKKLLDKKVHLSAAMFEGSSLQNDWISFGHWLQKRRGAERAAVLINRYASFFYEMYRHWKRVPSYPELLEVFGAGELRKVLNVIRWLDESNRILLDKDLQEKSSEENRIKKYFQSLEKSPEAYRVLHRYHLYLLSKLHSDSITIRTLRLSLYPASDLLKKSKLPITQYCLERYLRQHQGQRSSISGFITFVNREYGLALRIPWKTKTAHRRNLKKLEKEIVQLYCENTPDKEIKWIQLGLEYFHSIPRKLTNKVQPEDIIRNEDLSYQVIIYKAHYWLPPLK